MSLIEAEADLLSNNETYKRTFDRYNLDVLKVLCSRYRLVITPTGKRSSPLKNDYIEALNTYKVGW